MSEEGKVREYQPWVYHIFDDYNIIFDEKGSTYGTVRRAQWAKTEAEIDEAKAKLEIRKCYTNKDGETAGKGYTFSTEQGPHELTEGLVEHNFGDTKKILRSLRKREDFADSVKTINDDDEADDPNGEMFDMRDLLLGESLEG